MAGVSNSVSFRQGTNVEFEGPSFVEGGEGGAPNSVSLNPKCANVRMVECAKSRTLARLSADVTITSLELTAMFAEKQRELEDHLLQLLSLFQSSSS